MASPSWHPFYSRPHSEYSPSVAESAGQQVRPQGCRRYSLNAQSDNTDSDTLLVYLQLLILYEFYILPKHAILTLYLKLVSIKEEVGKGTHKHCDINQFIPHKNMMD